MKKIVISGTYCTGKTTLSLALSKATGIPVTHALTMREILPNLFPNKTLRQCSYSELLSLGMKRFEERIKHEALLTTGFISDGCTLQEWLYGSTRLYTGAYPDESPWKMQLKRYMHYSAYKNFVQELKGFEGLAKAYAKSHYDLFFHLPVEFDFVADGHRPTSERFRQVSESRLLQAYEELGIDPIWISGNLKKRLETILDYLTMKPVVSIETAIQEATTIRQLEFDAIQLEHSKSQQIK